MARAWSGSILLMRQRSNGSPGTTTYRPKSRVVRRHCRSREAHTVRLALIYALLDDGGNLTEHLRAALAFGATGEASAKYISAIHLGDPLPTRSWRRCGRRGRAG